MARQKREVNAADNLLHYRISVPKDDQTVAEWMEKQYNISMSIRQLVRAFVREHGQVDITCISVDKPVFTAGAVRVEQKTAAAPEPAPAAAAAPSVTERPAVEQQPVHQKTTKDIGDANDALSNMLQNGLIV